VIPLNPITANGIPITLIIVDSKAKSESAVRGIEENINPAKRPRPISELKAPNIRSIVTRRRTAERSERQFRKLL